MRDIGMRGIFSAIIAWAAIVLLFFSLSSGLYVEQNDRSLLKLQAGRELSEKTENFIRLLDKATADGFYYSGAGGGESCTGAGSNVQDYYNSVRGAFNAREAPYNCVFVGSPSINPDKTATGTIKCSVMLGATTISESRQFSFAKQWNDTYSPPSGATCKGISCLCTTQNPAWECQGYTSPSSANCEGGWDPVGAPEPICEKDLSGNIGKCCVEHEAECELQDSVSSCTEEPGFSC